MSERDVNLTDGKLLRPMTVLALPIVVSQMMQVGYNLADTFWVGRLGGDAVSALSFSWPVIFLMISVGAGFTTAGTVLVAQNKGAGNSDRVNKVAGQTVTFVALVATGFSVIGWVAAPLLLPLIGTTPGSKIHLLSVTYTRTLFTGVVFVFGFFVFQALLRGWGDTRTPMYIMAIGVALNVVLDPFLILGFQQNPLFRWAGMGGLEAILLDVTGFTGYGVQGAAIATVLARGTGAVVGLWLLMRGRVGIHLSPADFLLGIETVRRIIRIGTPSSVEMSARALGVTVMTALVALAGADAVAAYGIGNRLISLVFLPAVGVAKATETIVGQNLGAEKPERAGRGVFFAGGLLAVILVGITGIAYLFARPIVGVFIEGPGAQPVIAIGVDYLRIIAPTFAFMGVFRVVNGGFRGAGSTRTAMAFSLLSLWVFRVPVAYLLVTVMALGATGVWYGIAFSNVITTVVAIGWFTRGTWRENVVDDTPPPRARDAVADVSGDESETLSDD